MGFRGLGSLPRARKTRVSALLLIAGMLVAGCTATSAATHTGGGDHPEGVPGSPPRSLSLELTPRRGAQKVEPGKLVRVAAEHGELTKVRLANAEGKVVKGELNAEKTRWTSAEPLGYGKQYTLIARGVGEDGKPLRKSSTFTTAAPAQLASVWTNVPNGGKVGVGMPISFTFTAPISDKKAAERAIRITPSPEVEGAFHWFSDTWAVWRPKEHWQPGSTVKVDAAIYGKHLGGGVYGAQDLRETMRIGSKVVAIADGQSHHMTVWINDRKVRRMPIAMGKPGNNTPYGTYTVMSEHYGYTMDSSTYGVPVDTAQGYKISVTHASRMSNSGIFYHSAPWSEWAQGNTNTSHGCLNLSTANADWMMKKSKPGDIIKVRNSGGPKLEPTDGWSFWQMSWKQWTSGGVR